MLDGVGAIADEYPIPVLLDVGLMAFFWNLNTCEASKHPEVANVLFFLGSRFLWNKFSPLTLRWQSVL